MKKLFKELELNLTNQQEQMFVDYYNFIISENKKYNLTRITDYKEVLIKHFYDSLTLLKAYNFKENATICDIGSGAGFPGIPLKIVRPDLNIVLLESQTKKANFLNETIKLLNLEKIKVVNKRAEDYAKSSFESFDYVTARAVAPLNILSELSLPLVKVGGSFLAMKGSNYKSELEEAKNGIIILGGKTNKVNNFLLPLQLGERTIIIIDKYKSVKGYPRPYNQIKRKPL